MEIQEEWVTWEKKGDRIRVKLLAGWRGTECVVFPWPEGGSLALMPTDEYESWTETISAWGERAPGDLARRMYRFLMITAALVRIKRGKIEIPPMLAARMNEMEREEDRICLLRVTGLPPECPTGYLVPEERRDELLKALRNKAQRE